MISFVMKMEGVTFKEAIRVLCGKCGIEPNSRVDTVAMRKLQAQKAKEQRALAAYRNEYNAHMHTRQKCEMDLKRFAPKAGDQSMDKRYTEAMNTLEQEYLWLETHPWR